MSLGLKKYYYIILLARSYYIVEYFSLAIITALNETIFFSFLNFFVLTERYFSVSVHANDGLDDGPPVN